MFATQPSKEVAYKRLHSDEASSLSSSDDVEYSYGKTRSVMVQSSFRSHMMIVTIANLVLFGVSISLLGLWYYQTHLVLNAQLRRASTYSPIHDLFDLKMHAETLNGTLFPRKNGPSVARQAPSPEVDAVWQEWELTRPVPVTAAQIRAMGKDPSTVAKLEDKDWGLGDDAYAAVFDVYHQLHCLNALRMMTRQDYYGPAELSEVEGMMDIHVGHCIDMLMQALQCSGNVNLITMHWIDTQDFPFPDMSINRQCVDFEGLTQWRKKNTLDMDTWAKVMSKKPEGVKELKAPAEYYKYFPAGNSSHTHHSHLGAPHNEEFDM